jgi:hypothetical protein
MRHGKMTTGHHGVLVLPATGRRQVRSHMEVMTL